MQIVHRMYNYYSTYVLCNKPFYKILFKKKLYVFCIYFALHQIKTSITSHLISIIVNLFDQVLPNFFNRFDCLFLLINIKMCNNHALLLWFYYSISARELKAIFQLWFLYFYSLSSHQ